MRFSLESLMGCLGSCPIGGPHWFRWVSMHPYLSRSSRFGVFLKLRLTEGNAGVFPLSHEDKSLDVLRLQEWVAPLSFRCAVCSAALLSESSIQNSVIKH